MNHQHHLDTATTQLRLHGITEAKITIGSTSSYFIWEKDGNWGHVEIYGPLLNSVSQYDPNAKAHKPRPVDAYILKEFAQYLAQQRL